MGGGRVMFIQRDANVAHIARYKLISRKQMTISPAGWGSLILCASLAHVFGTYFPERLTFRRYPGPGSNHVLLLTQNIDNVYPKATGFIAVLNITCHRDSAMTEE